MNYNDIEQLNKKIDFLIKSNESLIDILKLQNQGIIETNFIIRELIDYLK